MIEGAHVPISVSIGDTLERDPTHLCSGEPAELIRMFMEELERRGAQIRARVRAAHMPDDVQLLPKKQRGKIEEWCDQVPVLGFNCGRYDLNLIKQHFAERLADTATKVRVAKKANKTVFILTPGFRFLDIINYLSPGTSYDKWTKAYGCKAQKSWFPYEWLDSPEKLNFPGLPDYPAWYSRLKERYVLKLSEWRACKRLFKERGMHTFADWLRYYNDLDVAPGLEALQRMAVFYTERGIDILKDAVGIPGASLHYLLRGSIERGAELYSPGKEAYEMLKGAVVGGPSIVFTRYHEAGVTRLRDHKFGSEAQLCRSILGYDANALYLSTMLRDMPCGREKLHHFKDPQQAAPQLMERLKTGKWFGFAEVDIEIPEALWPKFEEMCPLFYNKEVPREAVSEEMLGYLERTGRKRGDGKKLVGALAAEKLLLYAPLLRWYVEHGAVITAVYRTIDYQSTKIFAWFVEQVTTARRTGDTDKSKALLAEVFKLMGNSGYGKLIEALERQTNVIYTKNEKVVDRALRSAYFHDLDELGDAYELESKKPRLTIKRPFQIGIAVYQLAKLRMLEFYHDFLDKYIDRRDYELIQMDTDSNYMAISAERLEEVVRPELRHEFEAEKAQWLVWDKWSARTPGLFKLEYEGGRMIALCSKCYYADGKEPKCSAKGMSKLQNRINWDRFKAALKGSIDRAENRGFRMIDGVIATYEQQKLGLSAYYDKRYVLADGRHTEPIEYKLRAGAA
ncbi:MAG: DNA polymerase [Candidatus Thiodiazotropha sp. (ex Monitilora ramsayi)]|nr:DNA polymerase [Candidatus Thiodiazotropha sp. (ex Monitilora ramsayi)]